MSLVGVRCELAARMTAPSTQSSACVLGGRLVIHATTRARAARHGPSKRRPRRFKAATTDPTRCLCQEPRPTAWGGARRELAAQTTAPRKPRLYKTLLGFPWGRRTRPPRETGLERDGYDGSKPQLLTWCGVGGEGPRPTAWGGTRL